MDQPFDKAEAALDLYKSRDCSEKLFRGDKSYLGEKSMRVYHDEPVHSKIFIEFVALIVRNKIYTCLMDRMKELHKKKNYMTVPAALKELDKIELIRQADGIYRLDHAVTATQKDILQAFNLTAASVKKEAGELESTGYRDQAGTAGKEDTEAETGTGRSAGPV